jgi:PAS domain S-box-containing protein
VALGTVRDLDAALRACLDVTMEVSEVDCAGIYLANKDGGLDMVAHRGLSPEFVKVATHFHAQVALACLPVTGKSANSQQQRLPAPLDEVVRREGMTAWVIVPVYNNSQLVGTVNLGSRRDRQIPLWSRHAIEGFASHVGEAIARLAAEKGLRETQTNLQTLFDSMDDFAFVLDYDGRILHVNRLVRQRLGYSVEELRDMPMSNLHPADRQEETLDVLAEAFMTSKTVVSTVPLVTREGTPIPVETTWTRSRWSNREVLCGISRDVTERVRGEQALEAACREAEAANVAKTEFLANMSHELRTPLHGILSFATFGRKKARTAPAETLEEYFELIQQSGTNLLTLVNDLLDLSKLEAGKMDFAFRHVDLHALILQTVDEFRSMVSDRRLAIAFVQPEGSASVAVDENRLRQVIRNLLSNAIKFSLPGGEIEIHLARNDRSVRISVRDHGIGIPEEELDIVFDKFIQSSKTRTGAGGTGLGLAICREIVTAHKGGIWAESPDGGGALLVVEIPLDPRVDEPVERPSPIVHAVSASTDLTVPSPVPAAYD